MTVTGEPDPPCGTDAPLCQPAAGRGLPLPANSLINAASAIAPTAEPGADAGADAFGAVSKCSGSVGCELSGSFGERSARRSVVLRSAMTSKSACLGFTSSVTVAAFASWGEGVADMYSSESPMASTRTPRKIATALGGAEPERGG